MGESVGQLLGIPRAGSSLLDVAGLIEKGLPAKAVDRVKAALELTDREISEILDTSIKTISRLRKGSGKKLSRAHGDRLFRAANIFAIASDVLEGEAAAKEWLRTPQIGLNDRVPLDLLSTEAGAREVEELLGRIDFGVIS